jgi:hypothetical protein
MALQLLNSPQNGADTRGRHLSPPFLLLHGMLFPHLWLPESPRPRNVYL